MIITIIIILCIIVLALTGLCVWLCHSLKQERELRWDEISRAAGLENRLEGAYREWDRAEQTAMHQQEERTKLWIENIEMQDRISAILCPTNNHVWKDGVCTKCGRADDAEMH